MTTTKGSLKSSATPAACYVKSELTHERHTPKIVAAMNARVPSSTATPIYHHECPIPAPPQLTTLPPHSFSSHSHTTMANLSSLQEVGIREIERWWREEKYLGDGEIAKLRKLFDSDYLLSLPCSSKVQK